MPRGMEVGKYEHQQDHISSLLLDLFCYKHHTLNHLHRCLGYRGLSVIQ